MDYELRLKVDQLLTDQSLNTVPLDAQKFFLSLDTAATGTSLFDYDPAESQEVLTAVNTDEQLYDSGLGEGGRYHSLITYVNPPSDQIASATGEYYQNMITITLISDDDPGF